MAGALFPGQGALCLGSGVSMAGVNAQPPGSLPGVGGQRGLGPCPAPWYSVWALFCTLSGTFIFYFFCNIFIYLLSFINLLNLHLCFICFYYCFIFFY